MITVLKRCSKGSTAACECPPEMITERFGSPSADRMVLSCGPPPMKKALKGHLENLGFGDDSLFEF